MKRILTSIVTVFVTLLCMIAMMIIMFVCPAYELARSIKFLIVHHDQVGHGEWGFQLWYIFAVMMENVMKGVWNTFREELEKCEKLLEKDEA